MYTNKKTSHRVVEFRFIHQPVVESNTLITEKYIQGLTDTVLPSRHMRSILKVKLHVVNYKIKKYSSMRYSIQIRSSLPLFQLSIYKWQFYILIIITKTSSK